MCKQRRTWADFINNILYFYSIRLKKKRGMKEDVVNVPFISLSFFLFKIIIILFIIISRHDF